MVLEDKVRCFVRQTIHLNLLLRSRGGDFFCLWVDWSITLVQTEISQLLGVLP